MNCCTENVDEDTENAVDEEIGKWIVESAKRTSLSYNADIIYDHAAIYFDFGVFMKEFIIHLLHPLFCFIDPTMHGYYLRKPLYIFLIHFNGILIVLLIIASYQAGSVTALDRTEWLLPFLCFVLHRSSCPTVREEVH